MVNMLASSVADCEIKPLSGQASVRSSLCQVKPLSGQASVRSSLCQVKPLSGQASVRSSLCQVKPKDYKIGICCISAQHEGVRAMTGWLRIRIMCLSGVTCLHIDLLFCELALKIELMVLVYYKDYIIKM